MSASRTRSCNPQHACGEPEVWRIGHDEERQRSEYRAHQEIWTAAAQAIPGPVYIVDGGAERLEDAADVRVLQREPHLDPEKTETHIPDLPETQRRLLFHFIVMPVLRPMAAIVATRAG
jgi:hypothetical protein